MCGARRVAAVYIITLVVFVALDAAWIGLVAGPKFQAQLGDILRPEPLLSAALVFYLVYTAGLVHLAVQPAVEQRSLAKAASGGALVGLTAYATFDLTNLTIIRDWTVGLAALDIAWGVVVSALTAVAGSVVGIRLAQPAPRSAEGRS
jgi:uncharacterized membrane protein